MPKTIDELYEEIRKIDNNLNIMSRELLQVKEKLDRVIEFSETLQAKYLEEELEKAWESGKLRLNYFIEGKGKNS